MKQKIVFLSVIGVILVVSFVVFWKYANTRTIQEKPAVFSITMKKFPQGYTYAAWDWHPTLSYLDNSFFSEMSAKGVHTLYMDISDAVDIAELPLGEEKDRKQREFDAMVVSYISNAQRYNMDVEALTGASNWGDDSHRYLGELALEYVFSFNASHSDTAFTGIQFDIEPHGRESFRFDDTFDMFTQYTETVRILVDRFQKNKLASRQHSLRLGFAIPDWYDGEGAYKEPFTWKGKEQFLFFHLTDILGNMKDSYLVIMAYRTNADGPDGIIRRVSGELSYAKQNSLVTQFLVAQETMDVKPAKITYYGTTLSKLRDQIAKISLSFAENKNLAGFAFHDAQSFLQLKK